MYSGYVAIFFLLIASFSLQAQSSINDHYRLLIGGYTKTGKSDGIYVYDFDVKTGSFRFMSQVPGIVNPSYLTVSKDRKRVYAVNEVGKGNGRISAFNFDALSGSLELVNSVSSGGSGPCYVEVSDKGDYVFCANYGGGSLSAIRVNQDGSLSDDIQTIQHEGSSINKENQSRPHVHSTVLSPDNQFLLSADLGLDKVYSYRFDPSGAEPLSAMDPAFTTVSPGRGPRHIVFHPNGKFVYVIFELDGSISAYNYANGSLKETQSVSMLAPGFKGIIEAADIHISPDGKFLYGTNREESNELLIYAINKNGTLRYAGRQSTLGKGPRNFVIDPTGRFLLVANQNSDEIIIFKRNRSNGSVQFTGKKIAIGMPSCLKFVRIPPTVNKTVKIPTN